MAYEIRLTKVQMSNRAQTIIKNNFGWHEDDCARILEIAYQKLCPGKYAAQQGLGETAIIKPKNESEEREEKFWRGLDANLERGESISLKLYSDMKERDEAKDITKNITIIIEHDDIPDMVLKEALEGTGIDFGSSAKGIGQAAQVPYSPPG